MSRARRPSGHVSTEPIETLEGRLLLSTLPSHSSPRLHAPTLVAARAEGVPHRTAAPMNLNPALVAQPLLIRRVLAQPQSGHRAVSPLAASAPLTPAEIRNIYSFNQISNLGQGQTIAVVEAFDDPNIFSDVNTFDQKYAPTLSGGASYYSLYGDSSTWLTKMYPSGTQPTGNKNWGLEMSLDVEWMHAIAPERTSC